MRSYGDDLLVTGGTGFLGSHLVVTWLQECPGARIACLVRAPDGEDACKRLFAALSRALDDQGRGLELGELADRVIVIPGEVADASWRESDTWKAWLRDTQAFHVLHGAANLSFREEDRPLVWGTNVEGTRSLLTALVPSSRIASFNYVSTAYVAGTREGVILEESSHRPTAFNNVYEETKWIAEEVVRQRCLALGIAYRIFRPSIIIGHSRTYRGSAETGFYKVVDTIAQMTGNGRRGNAPVAFRSSETPRSI
jgi:thioester reductase-like protein